ncbi:MAG TPA: dUTP diphosphatase [Candidatus Megaira endosymbiont of Nemacystus decipiens]|nr:dUTP diphosphatase [Candidatus Megaera endosymbiont of Nemacystus decipiens]
MSEVRIKMLDNSKGLDMPHYSTESSAGMDLRAAIDQDVVIKSGEVKIIPTGIALALPENTEAQIRPRSGLAAKNSVTVLNTPGTIDADYRGEVKAILINHGREDFVVVRGMRIAQMVISHYIKANLKHVNSLDDTERGDGGFGSTGV